MAMAWMVVLGIVLALGVWLKPQALAWRRRRASERPFPPAWRKALRQHVPLVASLPPDRQLALKRLMHIFLSETNFIGCAGLSVSDSMRVVVAAQACLLLLGRREQAFEGLREVLLYPGAFAVNRAEALAGGLQREQRHVLAGESWTRGQVVLSWQDVLAGAARPDDGRNVVIHEFAHQLDQVKGRATGFPGLADPRHASAAQVQAWADVMQAEFERHRLRCDQGEPGLIDPYAASEPAEFFAVCSEVFYEQPLALAQAHPKLHAALVRAYGLDPLRWV
jgi:Mlc titration factor MtfA (ptsG expression regulator)